MKALPRKSYFTFSPDGWKTFVFTALKNTTYQREPAIMLTWFIEKRGETMKIFPNGSDAYGPVNNNWGEDGDSFTEIENVRAMMIAVIFESKFKKAEFA
jgi:hypothetical protein